MRIVSAKEVRCRNCDQSFVIRSWRIVMNTEDHLIISCPHCNCLLACDNKSKPALQRRNEGAAFALFLFLAFMIGMAWILITGFKLKDFDWVITWGTVYVIFLIVISLFIGRIINRKGFADYEWEVWKNDSLQQ